MIKVLSPVSGTAQSLEQVGDDVFAERILGDGVAVEPRGEKTTFHAPVSGTLSTMFRTGHAFVITTDDGADILVHIGIETVSLEGKGFNVLKEEGAKISAGDALVEVDLDLIRSEGKKTISPIILSNSDDYEGDVVEAWDQGQAIDLNTAIFSLKK